MVAGERGEDEEVGGDGEGARVGGTETEDIGFGLGEPCGLSIYPTVRLRALTLSPRPEPALPRDAMPDALPT